MENLSQSHIYGRGSKSDNNFDHIQWGSQDFLNLSFRFWSENYDCKINKSRLKAEKLKYFLLMLDDTISSSIGLQRYLIFGIWNSTKLSKYKNSSNQI